jgi:hypothetical protein
MQVRDDEEVELKARLLKKGDGIVVAEFGDVCLAVWRRDSTLHRFNVQRAGLDAVVERNPDGVVFFCVVEPTSGPPNEDVRKASSRLFDSHGSKLRAIAMVIEGTGFRSALVRSVASGIVMLMGSRTTPISYFATIEAGAQWAEQFVSIGSIKNFKRNVEQIRANLDPF